MCLRRQLSARQVQGVETTAVEDLPVKVRRAMKEAICGVEASVQRKHAYGASMVERGAVLPAALGTWRPVGAASTTRGDGYCAGTSRTHDDTANSGIRVASSTIHKRRAIEGLIKPADDLCPTTISIEDAAPLLASSMR